MIPSRNKLYRARKTKFFLPLRAVTPVLAFFLSISNPVWPGSPVEPGLLNQAEESFSRRFEISQAGKLIEIYRNVTTLDPGSETHWIALAYANFWLGNRLSLEKDTKRERLTLYLDCVSAAREAIRINPNSTGGNFWLVLCQGRYTQTHGLLGGSFALGDSIRSMQVVLLNDREYYFGGVDRYWGRVFYEVPGLLRKIINFTLEDSEYFLKRAISIAPDFLMNHRYLAETYLKMGEEEKARKVLEKILNSSAGTLPAAEPENLREQEIARRIWREKFKRLPLPTSPSG